MAYVKPELRKFAEVSMWSEKRKRFYKKVPPEVRFWAKVRKTRTCWLWIGGTQGPYGTFDGNTAHSWVAKHIMKVTVNHKMVIDHACRNQLCVRPHPKHLRFVPQWVNLMNGPNHIGQKILQTHCIRGHPLSGKNLKVRTNGRRVCRACRNIRSHNYLKLKSQKEK